MEKKMKIIRCLVALAVFVSLAVMDARAVQNIRSREWEDYSVQEHSLEERAVQTEAMETKFYAVSGSIRALKLWCKDTYPVSGSVAYCVLDATGAVVLESRTVDVADIWDGENQSLVLDVSEGRFAAGDTYFLQTEFALRDPFALQTDGNGLMHSQTYEVQYQGILYGFTVFLNLAVVIGVLAFLKWGMNDKLFLGMLLGTGIFVVAVTPPFYVEDEFRHFVRAYDLSCGGTGGYYGVPNVESSGVIMADEEGKAYLAEIPAEMDQLRLVDYSGNLNGFSYYAETNYDLCIPRLQQVFSGSEQDGTAVVSETGTIRRGLYSYWPQVVMLFLVRMIGIRSGLWYYFACLGQVLAASLLLWAALKLAKNHRNLFWLCSFLPPVLLLRGSASSDGLMITEILLSLAIILHMRDEKICLIRKKGLLLGALYLAVVSQVLLIKFPYALLCLGFLPFLRRENFMFITKERLYRYRKGLAAGGVLLVVLLSVGLFILNGADLVMRVVYAMLPKEYIDYILGHFGEITRLFLWRGKDLLLETVESLRGSYFVPYSLLMLVVLLLSKKQFQVGWKCYQAFLFLCMLGMVVLVGYTLTPPDYGMIWGITYRYMLPSIPALALAIPLGTEKTQQYAEQVYPIVLLGTVFSSCLRWML